ncbi:MAG: hypothetical protein IPM60_05665 [Rhodospirillales bacterium]|nr:hypothetical protein [Rhodospirillales bacterium]
MASIGSSEKRRIVSHIDRALLDRRVNLAVNERRETGAEKIEALPTRSWLVIAIP